LITAPLLEGFGMDVAAVHALVDAVVALRDAADERGVLCRGLGDVGRLRSWLQGEQAAVAGRLAAIDASPEAAVAEGAGVDPRAASKLLERANTVQAAPRLGAALLDGCVSGEHVDALARTLRQVEPGVRPRLVEQAESLLTLAASSTAEEFARRLRCEARRLQTDDGIARFERQCRDTRLRTWTDRDSGMWCLSGRFDPRTGATLSRALHDELARRYTEAVPAWCPSDPIEKQDHLRALALQSLIEQNGGGRVGRPEVIVVVDTREPDPVTGGPVVDWGIPVELPTRVLDQLLERADIHQVVVRNGVVIDAPGCVDLGRTTRLANRAQCRALRALYPTCGIPGCQTRFDCCRIHHIIEWEHGGTTDLVNLLPVCPHHHSQIHNDHWQLQLGADRTLTITYPNGTTMTTGPPRRAPP
jgi:hypothetical protein